MNSCAQFSEIFQCATISNLNSNEKSLFFSQFKRFGNCDQCDKQLSKEIKVFLHYVDYRQVLAANLSDNLWPNFIEYCNISSIMLPCDVCDVSKFGIHLYFHYCQRQQDFTG